MAYQCYIRYNMHVGMNNQLVTIQDKAYQELKVLILSRQLPEAEFLSQRMLAKRVNCTVIPVREALKRLENDGLIESVPRWGVRIPKDTQERVRDRYFMRETLEIAAVRRIREQNVPAAREQLMAQAMLCDEAALQPPETGTTRYVEAHFAFHSLIAELSQSPLLREAMKRLNLRSTLMTNAVRVWGRGIDREGAPHQTLVKTLFDADEDTALRAVVAHVRRGLDYELKAMRESSSD